jgi:hypothetical protein
VQAASDPAVEANTDSRIILALLINRMQQFSRVSKSFSNVRALL